MNQTDINAANDTGLARLEAVVSRLTPADLDIDLGDGWTVATALAHATFWDRRAAILLGRWEQGMVLEHENIEWYDHVLNEVIEPMITILPSSETPRLVLEAARMINDQVRQ